jgi:hypothetical protein
MSFTDREVAEGRGSAALFPGRPDPESSPAVSDTMPRQEAIFLSVDTRRK